MSERLRSPELRAPNLGTANLAMRLQRMTEQLPVLVETSLQIAWDFLDRTGGIADPQETAEFLLANIRTQVLQGERRKLALSNRAINAFRQRSHLQLVS